MKREKWSDYDKYVVMANNTKNLRPDYLTFVDYRNVVSFLNKIASTDSNTFSFEGTIYRKKISSNDASSILNNLSNNKFDRRTKIVANQLGYKL